MNCLESLGRTKIKYYRVLKSYMKDVQAMESELKIYLIHPPGIGRLIKENTNEYGGLFTSTPHITI